MKKIITVLLILLLSSCRAGDFRGNWYTCAHDGSYIEMFIIDDFFKYSTSYGWVTPHYKFWLSGDTLVYEDRNLFKDSVFVVKAIVQWKGSNEMTLDFLPTRKLWTFHRLTDNPGDIDIYWRLKAGTLERAKKYGCADERSAAEKHTDSVVQKIDFKF